MNTQAMRCVTLSDFNLDNFNALLAHDEARPSVEVVGTDYGQLYQYLLNANARCWAGRLDCAIVWTRPEAVIPSFKRLKAFERVDTGGLLDEVRVFADQLLPLEARVGATFIPTWTSPPEERGFGLLDMREEIGIANTLLRMNLCLVEALQDHPHFYVLNAERWMYQGRSAAYHPKRWAMAKIPFTNPVFSAAVEDVKAALQGLNGEAKRLIIVDLDDTLWGGVVGDDGWEHLQLGGHDPVGEAFVAFQQALKAMTNRGVLLGIVSKNTEEIALEALAKHPEMVLSLDDFAGWRINWGDKAENVASLVDELNLGLQSVVFIDDNPFEQARVREALPEVFVPKWPADPFSYRQTLLSMRCFDTASLTGEDSRRTSMYVAERKRTSLKQKVQSVGQWLETLEMKVSSAPFHKANRVRIVQLLNKTNQMNLRTRRMSEGELTDWLKGEGRCLRAFSVADRFGDAGVTGILSIEKRGEEVHIIDFVLSCRVMGRRVEETMLAVAAEVARQMGARTLIAEYRPTPKNLPCLDFWHRSGFENALSPYLFRWSLDESYPLPGHIELVQRAAGFS